MKPYIELKSSFSLDEYHFSDHDEFIEHLCNYVFDNITDLTDDWELKVVSTNLEPFFKLSADSIARLIIDANEDRFSQDDYDKEENQIYAALNLVDFKKANAKMPQLYYPNGEVFFVKKSDVIDGVTEYFLF